MALVGPFFLGEVGLLVFQSVSVFFKALAGNADCGDNGAIC